MCSINANYQIDVMNYTCDIHVRRSRTGSVSSYSARPMSAQGLNQGMLEANAILPSNSPETMDFTSIPQIMLDQDFIDLDRVIAFDDGSMFTTTFDAAASAW